MLMAVLTREEMNFNLNERRWRHLDDFLLFSYRYWMLIRDNKENTDKAISIFEKLCKTKNIAVTGKQYNESMEKYSSHAYGDSNEEQIVLSVFEFLKLLNFGYQGSINFVTKMFNTGNWEGY